MGWGAAGGSGRASGCRQARHAVPVRCVRWRGAGGPRGPLVRSFAHYGDARALCSRSPAQSSLGMGRVRACMLYFCVGVSDGGARHSVLMLAVPRRALAGGGRALEVGCGGASGARPRSGASARRAAGCALHAVCVWKKNSLFLLLLLSSSLSFAAHAAQRRARGPREPRVYRVGVAVGAAHDRVILRSGRASIFTSFGKDDCQPCWKPTHLGERYLL